MTFKRYIGCAVCLSLKGERVYATTIVKGYSVCDDHAKLADNPNFDIWNLKPKRGNT